MGHKVVEAQAPLPEAINPDPEVSPFAGIGHAALIVKFYETGADADIGRELSLRLLAHAGYTGDPTAEALIGKDTKPILDSATGHPFSLADYVNYAADHHTFALEDILNFLHTKPGEPDYNVGRAAYASYLDANRSQTGRG